MSSPFLQSAYIQKLQYCYDFLIIVINNKFIYQKLAYLISKMYIVNELQNLNLYLVYIDTLDA